MATLSCQAPAKTSEVYPFTTFFPTDVKGVQPYDLGSFVHSTSLAKLRHIVQNISCVQPLM